MLPTKTLIAIAIALGALLLLAPLHLVLLARFPLALYRGNWSLGGVLVDVADLVLGLLLLGYVLRGRQAADAKLQGLPYLLPWLMLGLFLTASYLHAPGTQSFLSSPIRIGYQLYRYCWKTIVFLPLGLLLLDSRAKMERAAFALVLAADIFALQATMQGYGGERGEGPFQTGNELAGALVGPLVLSLFGWLVPQARFRLFWIASTLLMLRGLSFTSSRGGIVAVLAGACFCLAFLATRRAARARALRLLPAVVFLGAVVLLIKPDLAERPTVRRALSAREGVEARTFQWRLQERWPYFIERVKERPWLGFGTAVDRELVARRAGAPTPHNGYLAMAVSDGIPAALLYLLLALAALKNGLRVFSRSEDPRDSILGLFLAGALCGILVHNIVEASLRIPFTRDLFWLICALCAQKVRLLRPAPPEAPHEPLISLQE